MNKIYKIEGTKGGNKVHQIIDGWHFTTILPSSIPIIIKEVNNDTMICGNCAHYDGRYCMVHSEYGEMVEKDNCDDYKECD